MGLKVFVSYQRGDSPHASGRLRDQLALAFGEENVFFDVDSIPPGRDFREVIRAEMQAAKVVVWMIGPGFDVGPLRDERNFVRIELREAMRQMKIIVPVLIDAASMPAPAALPKALKELAYRNAWRIRRDPDFRRDVGGLIAFLGRPGNEDLRPRALSDRQVREEAYLKTRDRFALMEAQVRFLLKETVSASDQALAQVSKGLSDTHYIAGVAAYGLFLDGTLGAGLRLEIDWRQHGLSVKAGGAQIQIPSTWTNAIAPSLWESVRTFDEAVRDTSLSTDWAVTYNPRFNRAEVDRFLGLPLAPNRQWARDPESAHFGFGPLTEASLVIELAID